MPKAGIVGGTPRRRAQRPRAELANAVEGHIAEICRDLAVQAKRMQQLREQADELRTFREIATLRTLHVEPPPDRATDLDGGARRASRSCGRSTIRSRPRVGWRSSGETSLPKGVW